MTHCTSSVVTPNSFCRLGMATLTMLVSRMDMNIPTISTTSGSPQPVRASGTDAARAGWVATPLGELTATPYRSLPLDHRFVRGCRSLTRGCFLRECGLPWRRFAVHVGATAQGRGDARDEAGSDRETEG